MIPNQWYPVSESKRLRRKPLALRRFSEELVLWRDADGRAVCMQDRCPHRGVALSRGRVVEGTLECPYHGFRYAPDGECKRMPCEGLEARIPKTMRAEAYLAVERHGLVWVFWGEATGDLPDIPWFDEVGAADPCTASATLAWPVNHVRTIETNFDVHHFPFAHRSFAYGVGQRCVDLQVTTEGTHIVMTGRMVRPDQLSDPKLGWHVRIEFKAPTVTLLGLGENMLGVIADCPVDEQNTLRFIRFRQSYTRLPLLRKLVAWLVTWSELRLVQPQDLHVLETQRPALPDLERDHLVRADLGTAAYLKLRRRLIDEARGPTRLPVVGDREVQQQVAG